jgi:pSer/pThr/pTyr-binding forkhead associated (FHA) protein
MKSFLTACGLADPLQLVVESQSDEEGELRLLHQPFALIGRDPQVDLFLDHARVSRRHVYLQVIEGQAFWVDLESRTGTRAGEELQKSGWLEGGRTLGVGPYVIRRFVGDGQIGTHLPRGKLPHVTPFVVEAYNHALSPEVALEFLNGPSEGMTWPIRRVMSLIGSAGGCKFRLTDASVSRFHGSFVRTSVGLWIIDLLGQGGIIVNEVPVRFSHLADGDLLRIGRYQIRIGCRPGRQGSGNRLPDRTGAKAFARPPRREHVSSGFNTTDRATAAVPFVPGTGVANLAQFPVPIPAHSSLTNIEVRASEATFPLKLAPSGLTESMLVPLISQFGLMQQQMFDQFQQAMAMMVQMFGTMHREQMEMIRAELDALHDLTEEFQVLKQELANRTQEEGEDGTMVSGAPAIASIDDLDGPITKAPNAPAKATANGSSGLKITQVDARSAVQSTSSASSIPEQQSLPSPGLSSPLPSSNPSATQPSADESRESGPRFQAKTNGVSSPADSERDSIVWLHQRIITLQRERETRWQKILKLLPGAS